MAVIPFRKGVTGPDPGSAARTPLKAFREFSGPFRLDGRLLKGDLRLGMGRGEPFQNVARVGVMLGLLALKIVPQDGRLNHHGSPACKSHTQAQPMS